MNSNNNPDGENIELAQTLSNATIYNELMFWSQKLQITPSELLELSEEELDRRLNDWFKCSADLPRSAANYELPEVMLSLVSNPQNPFIRLAGGEMPISPTIWAILTQAANKIEEYVASLQNNSSTVCDEEPSHGNTC